MYTDLNVLDFLAHFKTSKDIEEVFTKGCCFWFAYILAGRYKEEGSIIVYDQVANHFGAQIGDRVYDITGDVTNQYDWENWNDLMAEDELLAYSVIKDCVLFL